MPRGSAAVALPGAVSSLSHWIMGIKSQLLALGLLLPATASGTSPALWNAPARAQGPQGSPVMWVYTAPGLPRGAGCPCARGLCGASATEGNGFGFFSSSFKIAAGDPLSSGKLVLERDY